MLILSHGSRLNKSKIGCGGFTLFELIVAIAVVALMMGMVVTRVNDWFDVNIKNATNKLSSTIRYLHDKAATQNLYIRLVFDFEKNSYIVEATTEKFFIVTNEMVEAEKKETEEEKKSESPEVMESGSQETGTEDKKKETGYTTLGTAVEKYRTPEFSPSEEFLLKPVSLPDGVFLKDVYTGHDTGPISAGKAYIYFFPDGSVEPAIINLKNEDDTIHFSIEVNPLIGTTYTKDEYKAMDVEKEK